MKHLLRELFNKSSVYRRKKGRDNADRSVYFGVSACIGAIFTVLLAFLGMYGIRMVSDAKSFLVILLALFVLLIGIIGALCFIVTNVQNVIYQFKMNKHWIRWPALVLFLISLVGSIVVIFVMNGM